MPRNALVWTLLALLVGLAVGLGTGRVARTRERADAVERTRVAIGGERGEVARARTGAGLAERIGDVERELVLLRRALEDAALAPVPAAEPGEPRRLVDAPERWDEILAALARIEEQQAAHTLALLELREQSNTGPPAIARLRDAGVGIDWAAWQPILDRWPIDREAAQESVKLLTAAQMLDRFGPPSDVWVVAQGITWQYARDRDPVTDAWGTEIILRIPDGYVTQMAVRGTDW